MTNGGMTALMVSVSGMNTNVYVALINANANPLPMNGLRETALEIARISYGAGHEMITTIE